MWAVGWSVTGVLVDGCVDAGFESEGCEDIAAWALESAMFSR